MWRLYIFPNIFSHCTKNCRNFAARMKESMKKNCTQCLSAHETAPWGLSIIPPCKLLKINQLGFLKIKM